MMSNDTFDSFGQGVRRLGGAVTGGVAWLGYAGRFIAAIVMHSCRRRCAAFT